MADALTAPFAVAALVLCAAGVAKLRSPVGAVRALVVLGVPARTGLVRAFAGGEVALALWALLAPTTASAGTVALVYASFCVASLLLARRRAACGCFGDSGTPASAGQALLSAALALIAVSAAVASVHGIGWVVGQGFVLTVGIAASAYAAVVAYTQLPAAWSAWSAR